MLLPALTVQASGELDADQLQWLRGTLQLSDTPRPQGYGSAGSIAHRTFSDDDGTSLVLDLARISDANWVLSLIFEQDREPTSATVEHYRGQLRDVVARLGLELVQVIPPVTADEVSDPPPNIPDDSHMVTSWELPYTELDQMWMHVGLHQDAPREVKEVKLRQVMRTPAWEFAPEPLRSQAEQFLAER